ncbi:MAG: hypothetical protein K9N21_08940 [Deltaproteobacteria bacterium]|nr:hypothetical protein [Deltaproteobacteria bacterium]
MDRPTTERDVGGGEDLEKLAAVLGGELDTFKARLLLMPAHGLLSGYAQVPPQILTLESVTGSTLPAKCDKGYLWNYSNTGGQLTWAYRKSKKVTRH